jgi:hypothetical protein
MAFGQLLALIFNTVDVAHSAFAGGDAAATWRSMLLDAIDKQMATHGSIRSRHSGVQRHPACAGAPSHEQ